LNLKGFNHPVLAVEILRRREDGEQEDNQAASVEKVEPATPAAARRMKQ
jgi:hypothetical protein